MITERLTPNNPSPAITLLHRRIRERMGANLRQPHGRFKIFDSWVPCRTFNCQGDALCIPALYSPSGLFSVRKSLFIFPPFCPRWVPPSSRRPLYEVEVSRADVPASGRVRVRRTSLPGAVLQQGIARRSTIDYSSPPVPLEEAGGRPV